MDGNLDKDNSKNSNSSTLDDNELHALREPSTFSAWDKFFFVLTTSGFICGATFTCLLFFIPFPILPSIFFGSAISSLVYRFMGGIKPEDSIQIGAIKLSGTLASLIASIYAINYMFQQQIPPWTVKINPDNNIIVLSNDGAPVELDVQAQGVTEIKAATVDKANPNLINSFQKACWEGNGICASKPKAAIFISDKSVSEGEAKVCMNNLNLIGLPLIIANDDFDATRVEAQGVDECQDPSGELLKVKISHEDAMTILKGERTGKGYVAIAPLRNLKPKG